MPTDIEIRELRAVYGYDLSDKDLIQVAVHEGQLEQETK